MKRPFSNIGKRSGDSDKPAAEVTGAASGGGSAPQAQAAASTAVNQAVGSHPCPTCKAPMADNQDWCTQCGNRSDANRRARAGWLSAGGVIALSAVLATTAAAAGIAALTESGVKEPTHPRLALAPPTPVLTTTTATTGGAVAGTPETLKAPRFRGSQTTTTTTTRSKTSRSQTTTTITTASSSTVVAPTEASTTTRTSRQPSLEGPELEGVTASAYSNNAQYTLAALEEGEDGQGTSRAVEGPESETAWKIHVLPGTNENMNVGLLLHLHGATDVGSVELHTSTPGFPLEVWGTTAATAPASITQWTLLGVARKLKKTKTVKLSHTHTAWKEMLLWIAKVPATQSSVSVGEVALFEPGG